MIRRMFKSGEESHFWVGGYKKTNQHEEEWCWCDSSEWTFSNWASNRNGSLDHLAIDGLLGYWYDHDKSNLLPSVCQHAVVGKIDGKLDMYVSRICKTHFK